MSCTYSHEKNILRQNSQLRCLHQLLFFFFNLRLHTPEIIISLQVSISFLGPIVQNKPWLWCSSYVFLDISEHYIVWTEFAEMPNPGKIGNKACNNIFVNVSINRGTNLGQFEWMEIKWTVINFLVFPSCNYIV